MMLQKQYSALIDSTDFKEFSVTPSGTFITEDYLYIKGTSNTSPNYVSVFMIFSKPDFELVALLDFNSANIFTFVNDDTHIAVSNRDSVGSSTIHFYMYSFDGMSLTSSLTKTYTGVSNAGPVACDSTYMFCCVDSTIKTVNSSGTEVASYTTNQPIASMYYKDGLLCATGSGISIPRARVYIFNVLSNGTLNLIGYSDAPSDAAKFQTPFIDSDGGVVQPQIDAVHYITNDGSNITDNTLTMSGYPNFIYNHIQKFGNIFFPWYSSYSVLPMTFRRTGDVLYVDAMGPYYAGLPYALIYDPYADLVYFFRETSTDKSIIILRMEDSSNHLSVDIDI